MQTLLDVVNVEARDDYSLVVTFENGAKRRFDMKPLLEKKPFLRLKVAALFKKASVGLGTVIWPGGIDIAPETLWDHSTPV